MKLPLHNIRSLLSFYLSHKKVYIVHILCCLAWFQQNLAICSSNSTVFCWCHSYLLCTDRILLSVDFSTVKFLSILYFYVILLNSIWLYLQFVLLLLLKGFHSCNAICYWCYLYLQPLADAYGLLMHRNGQWEWTLAPGVSPSPRYQHAAVSFCGCVSKYFVHQLKGPPGSWDWDSGGWDWE